jgi:hypothetical protein
LKATIISTIISSKGIEFYPKRIKAIRGWTTPENVTKVRPFMGLFNYY